MNPSRPDPQNHVPKVALGDGWGDADGIASKNSGRLGSGLPPRRTARERPAPTPRTGSTEVAQRLEVQEISGSVVRLNHQAPAPLKVPRLPTFIERPPLEDHPERPRGENRQWGATHRRPNHWILGAGVLVVAIVVVTLMLLPSINAPNAARAIQAPAVAILEEKIQGMDVLNVLILQQPEAMQIFRAYATASHVNDLVPTIRDGHALRETLRRHWRPKELSKRWAPAADSTWNVLELSGHPCGVLEGTFPDQTKYSAYFILEDGRLLLDWKATAAFGTASFGQLEKNTGDPGEIRGEISHAEFYSSLFPEADYQSYRLLSPDGQIAIWCYARRGAVPNQVISPLFHKGDLDMEVQQSRKVTVRLEQGPDGALPNQWLIGDVLHLDWVTP